MEAKHQRLLGLHPFDSIPEEIVFENIIPRLPIKSCCRFKSVSKKWRLAIRKHFFHNSAYAATDTTSGTMSIFFSSEHTVVCLPTPENMHDTHSFTSHMFPLDFLDGHEFSNMCEISASTDGLVCLVYYGGDCCTTEDMHLCLCNPVLKEAWQIPNSIYRKSVGLAYDPSSFGICHQYHYKLVHPSVCEEGKGSKKMITYSFEEFSSDLGQWIKTNQEVSWSESAHVNLSKPSKSVYANGVLYWNCNDERLIWFDCNSSQAGYVYLPGHMYVSSKNWLGFYAEAEIGVSEDRVTYTRVTKDSVEVQRLVEIVSNQVVAKWERVHLLSFQLIVNNNLDIVQSFMDEAGLPDNLRYHLDGKSILGWLFVHPLPFEGGEKVVLSLMIGKQPIGLKLLSCDLKTGKGAVFSVGETPLRKTDVMFGYKNASKMDM